MEGLLPWQVFFTKLHFYDFQKIVKTVILFFKKSPKISLKCNMLYICWSQARNTLRVIETCTTFAKRTRFRVFKDKKESNFLILLFVSTFSC